MWLKGVVVANPIPRSCRDFVVDAISAGPQLPGVVYYGIEATHSNMCKFESATASGYFNVSNAILQWISEAPESIQARWKVEEEEKGRRVINEVYELVRHSVCQWSLLLPPCSWPSPSRFNAADKM
jgi:hypothetical protein